MAVDLLFKSAGEMAQLVCNGQISAVELLKEHLAQIVRHNPALNAIISLDEDGARRRAKEADAALARGEIWGPLHGVPMTIKDSFETAGMRTTSGYPPLKDYIPEKDAAAVARLRSGGAVIVGKTNLPTLTMDAQTNNPIFGPTSNPWNLAYNCGGSSGGAAVALAAGMTALELGSDIGGSCRLPAHSCGVFGFKPTERRVPGAGHIPPLPGTPPAEGSMNCFGPLARTVEDLILALRLIAGPHESEWEIPPVPLGSLPEVRCGDLCLAWADQFGAYPVTQDTRAAIGRLVADLTGAGCNLKPARLDGIDFAAAYEAWNGLIVAGVPSKEREIDMRQYTHWMQERYALTTAVNRVLESCDALICPVAMRPAFQHCPQGTPLEVDGRPVEYLKAQLWYTFAFNLSGHPAISIPLALSREGLPIGVQVVGKRWQDLKLLAIAGRLAEITGPFRIPPGFEAR